LSMLEPYGSLAFAAGLRWNKDILLSAKHNRNPSLSSIKNLVSSTSIMNPGQLTVRLQTQTLLCEWESVLGFSLYEIQMAADSTFSKVLRRHITQHPQARLALSKNESNTLVFVRVRALDRKEDLQGAWSALVSFSVPNVTQAEELPAPVLTSPLDQYESEGFNVTLEWIVDGDKAVRIQVSENSSFSDTVIDEVSEEREYALPGSVLDVNKSYYWRAQTSGNLISPWSNSRRFHINTPEHAHSDVFINPELPK